MALGNAPANTAQFLMATADPSVPGGIALAAGAGLTLSVSGKTATVSANPQWAGTSGGTANAQTLTPSPAIAAYAAGQTFTFIAGATNTGAATMAISGLSAKALTKQGATALAASDVLSAGVYTVVYDGTQLQVINPATT